MMRTPPTMGHNEAAVRLAALAGDAQVALDRVARGEAEALDGWLAYGAALNEGRALFPGDREFGEWLRSANLAEGVHDHERAAAMWAAANADQFAEARAAGSARTVRGIHAKWKEIEAERERAAKEAERKAELETQRAAAQDAQAAVDAARAEAASAKTEADKAEAEAEAKAEEVTCADDEEVDPAIAKARRELAKLTTEALIDDVIGLRQALAEAKAKASKRALEIEMLKERLADFTSDKDETIRRLQDKVRHKEGQMWKATEDTAAAMRQVYALKKRVAELENMEIPLN